MELRLRTLGLLAQVQDAELDLGLHSQAGHQEFE
jgi:hypothetical protein